MKEWFCIFVSLIVEIIVIPRTDAIITRCEHPDQVCLSGGTSNSSGNLYVDGLPVCDDGWDVTAADVVCRQLGFSGGAKRATVGSFFGEEPLEVFSMDEVQCKGRETKITDCGHSKRDDCGAKEVAGVICDDRSEEQVGIDERMAEDCFIGNVSYNKGSYIDGAFMRGPTTIIGSALGCQQYCMEHQNCTHFTYYPYLMLCYRKSSGTKYEVDGSISGPRVCNMGGKINISEEANITCNGGVCIGGSGQVGNGNVFVDGKPVCDDYWNLASAQVVCKQLGFSGALNFTTNSFFGQVRGLFAMDDVNCTGRETNIMDCSFTALDNCNGNEGAGVVCDMRPREVVIREEECYIRDMEYISSYIIDEDQEADSVINCQKLCFSQVKSNLSEECSHFSWFFTTQKCVLFGFGKVGSSFNKRENVKVISGPRSCEEDKLVNVDGKVNCTGITLLCLSGSKEEHEGNLFLAGKPICQDGWDMTDAHVACRQLGYFRAVNVTKKSYFGKVSNVFAMNFLNCKGSEDLLVNCSHTFKDTCDGFEAAGVICDERNRSAIFQMEEEMKSNCFAQKVVFGTLLDHEHVILPTAIDCQSYCISHQDCDTFAYYPSTMECYRRFGNKKFYSGGKSPPISGPRSCAFSPPQFTEIHCRIDPNSVCLDGGSTVYEGNVYTGGYPICDDTWSLKEAHVVCQQLGFVRAKNFTRESKFGNTIGSFAMDNVDCSGSESQIRDCAWETNHNCIGNEAAGVICETDDERLLRDECFVVGVSYNQGDWIGDYMIKDSAEECQEYCVKLPSCSHFTYYPIEKECYRKTGNQKSDRSQGPISGPRSCEMAKTSINIRDKECLQEGKVCLKGGNKTHEGNIFVGGKPVCDDEWSLINAAVVCRELGLSGEVISITVESYFGQVSGIFSMDDVQCIGNESNLTECTASNREDNCDGGEGAGVICDPRPLDEVEEEKNMINHCFLQDAIFSPLSPYVVKTGVSTVIKCFEICNGWDQCTHFSFSGNSCSLYNKDPIGDDVRKIRKLGTISGPASCKENSSHILKADEMCVNNATSVCLVGETIPWWSRLIGDTSNEGNVFFGGNPVCDDSWGIEEANVVCGQLGFFRASNFTQKSHFGQVSMNFSMDEVSCKGNESSLADCMYSEMENCDGTEAAGVICDNRNVSQILEEAHQMEEECFVENVIYGSLEDQDPIYLPTSIDCQTACKMHSSCTTFSYFPKSKECHLRIGMEPKRLLVSNTFLVVADKQVIANFTDVEKAKDTLKEVSHGSRLIAEVDEHGNLQRDPHTVAGQLQARPEFNKYWHNWHDINRMMDICEEFLKQAKNEFKFNGTNVLSGPKECSSVISSLLIGFDCGLHKEICLYSADNEGNILLGSHSGNVFVGGKPICDNLWNINDGNVICKQLGHGAAKEVTKGSRFGQVSLPFGMANVECDGTEKSIRECRNDTTVSCIGSEAAGVICESYLETQARFRKELKHRSCYIKGVSYDQGNWIGDYVDKNSAEECQQWCLEHQDCKHFTWYHDSQECYRKSNNRKVSREGTISGPRACSPTIGIPKKDPCSRNGTGPVCLRGGSGDYEGNVFVQGKPVCDDNWDMKAAHVVCWQLGYQMALNYTTRSKYGSVPGIFSMDDVSCSGTEISITSCTFSSSDNCDGGEGAGVVCSKMRDIPLSDLVSTPASEEAETSPRCNPKHVVHSGDEYTHKNIAFRRPFPPSNVLQNDCDSWIWHKQANYWLSNNRELGSLTIDLGCPQVVDNITIKNTHNGDHNDRGTNQFNVSVSNHIQGPWITVLVDRLADASHQGCSVISKLYSLNDTIVTEANRTGQFVKFAMMSYYGAGGGLQYLNIQGHKPSPIKDTKVGSSLSAATFVIPILLVLLVGWMIWAREKLVGFARGWNREMRNHINLPIMVTGGGISSIGNILGRSCRRGSLETIDLLQTNQCQTDGHLHVENTLQE